MPARGQSRSRPAPARCAATRRHCSGKDNKDDPSYNGDRILVDKLSYDFSEPQRWDVIVFKYPGGAATNFIKRLVGLPGETIRIQDGDVWVRSREDKGLGDAGFAIARKPPRKLLAMLQPVFDNDYMPRIAKYGWPARWYCDSAGGAAAWTSEGYTTFRSDGAAAGENWLRYHHLTPSYDQWQASRGGSRRASRRSTPQLITDFTAYDTGQRGRPTSRSPSRRALAPIGSAIWRWPVRSRWRSPTANWPSNCARAGGDSSAASTWPPAGRPSRSAATTWSAGGPRRRRASAARAGTTSSSPIATTNCGCGSTAAWSRSTRPRRTRTWATRSPTDADLAPVGVASKGAAVRISHLRVLRDIYYIADARRRQQSVRSAERHVDFSLESPPSEPEQFFVLGDNSPKSKDGRLWGDGILGQPRVADRQGVVHLLAPFVGRDSHALGQRSLPLFPQLRPDGAGEMKLSVVSCQWSVAAVKSDDTDH